MDDARPETPPTRESLERLDRADPLGGIRDRFYLPAGVIYLDGNSLGALPKTAPVRVAQVVEEEWGRHLIGGWRRDGWMDYPERLGNKIAHLIGAGAGEVITVDTTSVNLFKLIAAALTLRPTRKTVLSDTGNFPSDVYMAQGLIELLGAKHRLKLVEEDQIEAAIDGDTALVMVTHVNYKSGRVHDMAAITRAAQAKGALMLWDLCHSAGAVPVNLTRAGADLAVGCGYKFLNGGPGAPAFLYVAQRHHDRTRQPLTGWLGHADPFAFDLAYRPAPGILHYKCSTPPIVALAALECGVDIMLEAGMDRLRQKSMALGDLFIRLMDTRLADRGFRPACPRNAEARGSQVSFHHDAGYAIMQALIERGVVGDFRAPDIMRFGLTPAYTRHVDIWNAVEILARIMDTKAYDRPEWREPSGVT
ncbi:MAG: kynureninase [Proteobacteria bacterium]|nr:kynureninase [Pseudomonadota bacterium]MBI3497974.1 kynureninase [Pseudomonadota bacterium]